MVVLIDNYGSFTYNLYQMAGEFCPDIRVVGNNELTAAQVHALHPSHIILSPGPGKGALAGISPQVVRECKDSSSILGISLGCQAICEVFGAETTSAKKLVHGKTRPIHIANGSPLFGGLPPIVEGGHYHSLSVVRSTLPDELLVIAEWEDGEVMGIKHRDYDIYGLQFHPESILTVQGKKILSNFMGMGGGTP